MQTVLYQGFHSIFKGRLECPNIVFAGCIIRDLFDSLPRSGLTLLLGVSSPPPPTPQEAWLSGGRKTLGTRLRDSVASVCLGIDA